MLQEQSKRARSAFICYLQIGCLDILMDALQMAKVCYLICWDEKPTVKVIAGTLFLLVIVLSGSTLPFLFCVLKLFAACSSHMRYGRTIKNLIRKKTAIQGFLLKC